MSLLATILTALAPHLIDLFIEIIRAEKDPALDTGKKKHDHVLNKIGKTIDADPNLKFYDKRDVMSAANLKIRDTVAKLNDVGEFEKGNDK